MSLYACAAHHQVAWILRVLRVLTFQSIFMPDSVILSTCLYRKLPFVVIPLADSCALCVPSLARCYSKIMLVTHWFVQPTDSCVYVCVCAQIFVSLMRTIQVNLMPKMFWILYNWSWSPFAYFSQVSFQGHFQIHHQQDGSRTWLQRNLSAAHPPVP